MIFFYFDATPNGGFLEWSTQEPDGAWQGTRQELSKGTKMCFVAGVMV